MNTSATSTQSVTTGNMQEDLARGMAAAQAGDKASAYRIFQALATRNADDAELWVWLGGTSPNLDDAEAAFQRAVLLDPHNEEANLGLRWVGLRRQMMGAVSQPQASATSPIDTSIFSTGRNDRNSSLDLSTTAFEAGISAATGPLRSGILSPAAVESAPGTGAAAATMTGPLRAEEADKSLKMKVDGRTGRRGGVPIGAIILILIALSLYAFAAWMLFFNK